MPVQAGTPRSGTRLGNVRVRRARRQPSVVEVRKLKVQRPARANPLYLVAGFAALIAAGTVLLALPFATESGDRASLTTALFTATSAVCVTGLVVVDTADYWSRFGEAVILVLIQLGGLGFMTSATVLILVFGGRLTLRQRLVVGETLGRLGVRRVGQLVRRIVIVTLTIEAVGAALTIAIFMVGESSASPAHAWRGLFTAVSAFNNAGFDLEGSFASLIGHGRNLPLLTVTGGLVVLGGTGFPVWSDVVRRRRWSTLSVDTKLVLLTSAALWSAGAAVIFFFEMRAGGELRSLDPITRVVDAIALSVYARTAGFTVVDVAGLSHATVFFLCGLMFIGGAAASTAGGIKLTTFSTLFFAIVTSLRGDEHVTVFQREISWRQVNRALAIALLSVAIVFVLVFSLTATSNRIFVELLFEAVSAFGTVGLSTGVTPALDEWGRLTLIAGMFIGRLGPLTIALALAGRARTTPLRYPEEVISIG
ncbi:MAG: Trk family potassium uptake protein [Chloroflexi bacterium]|nr:Trk family potassium uptake protein [Chloroflexota bacterium]